MMNNGDPYRFTRRSIDSRANGSCAGSSSNASPAGNLRILAVLLKAMPGLTRAQFERVTVVDAAGPLQSVEECRPAFILRQLLDQDPRAARAVERAQMVVEGVRIGVRFLARVDPGHVALRIEWRAHGQDSHFFLPGDEL